MIPHPRIFWAGGYDPEHPERTFDPTLEHPTGLPCAGCGKTIGPHDDFRWVRDPNDPKADPPAWLPAHKGCTTLVENIILTPEALDALEQLNEAEARLEPCETCGGTGCAREEDRVWVPTRWNVLRRLARALRTAWKTNDELRKKLAASDEGKTS